MSSTLHRRLAGSEADGGEGAWRPDILDRYSQRELVLAEVEPLSEEGGQALVATLVRLDSPNDEARPAVLYVHGWNDYFFQTHLAEFWDRHGYAFYAIDLRRYGRSLRPGQLLGFISDLSEYDLELGLAVTQLKADHGDVLLMGHSTGGLIASIWAADHPGEAAGLVLNSPWLDLQATAMVRALGAPIIDVIGSRVPTAPLRLPETDFYGRTIRRDTGGEWDFDPDWKAGSAAVVRVGWLRAVLKGHDRIAAGLGIEEPILVLASRRSVLSRRWREQMKAADTVLDVAQIAGRAHQLGRTVTVERIDGGLHDLVLSPPPVREQVFAAISRWLSAYGPAIPSGSLRSSGT